MQKIYVSFVFFSWFSILKTVCYGFHIENKSITDNGMNPKEGRKEEVQLSKKERNEFHGPKKLKRQ